MTRRLEGRCRSTALWGSFRPRAAACVGLLATSACREPTQITLEVTTDLSCERVDETAISVGTIGGAEEAAPATITARCDGRTGRIGSLVLVPSGSLDARVALRVVSGVGRSVARCATDGYRGGCIVARRALRYLPRTPLRLPIAMTERCIDVECDPRSTCFEGSCVPATVTDPGECARGAGCELEGPASDAGAGSDGAGGRPAVDAATDVDGGAGGRVTVTFGERDGADVTGVTKDACLYGDRPSSNLGGNAWTSVDGEPTEDHKGLLRFELAAIPVGSRVVDAELRLWTNDPSGGVVDFHRLLESWDEGSETGIDTAGFANHEFRAPSLPWLSVGAGDLSVDPAVVGSVQPSLSQTEYSIALDRGAIQTWVDDPSTNHGLRMMNSSGDGVIFQTREHGDPTQRPLLRIVYDR